MLRTSHLSRRCPAQLPTHCTNPDNVRFMGGKRTKHPLLHASHRSRTYLPMTDILDDAYESDLTDEEHEWLNPHKRARHRQAPFTCCSGRAGGFRSSTQH
jgi:hypothetical protein